MIRRSFLKLAATSSLMATCASWLGLRLSPSPTSLAQPELLQILQSKAALIGIGQKYRALYPEENDPNTLARHLQPSFASRGIDIPALLNAQSQRDFSCGSTVQIDGWILSKTEARQSALYSILHT